MSFTDFTGGFTSQLPTGLGLLAAAAEGLIPPVLFRSRIIGPFIADVTVEEHHQDELAVTEHPVEQGAAISDHSYKRPAQLTVTAGWSNSSRSGNPVRVQMIYAAFLALQASRVPFEVLTGKRFYLNMLITSLETTTTEKFENAMMLTCQMKELILVSTQTLVLPPAQTMASPQINAPTVQAGTQALTPATGLNNSALPPDIPSITVQHIPGV